MRIKQFSLSDFSSNSFGGDLLHYDVDSKLLFVGDKVFQWDGNSLSEKTTLSSVEKYFGKKDNLIFTVRQMEMSNSKSKLGRITKEASKVSCYKYSI